MRKYLFFILMISAIFTLGACQDKSTTSTLEPNEKIPTVLTEDLNDIEKSKKEGFSNPFEKDTITEDTKKSLFSEQYSQNIITDKMLSERLDNQATGVVYFYSPSCSHCIATTPVLWDASKQTNSTFAMYNILEFENGWVDYRIGGTPTLIYYKDGKEVSRLEGSQSLQKYISFFEEIE